MVTRLYWGKILNTIPLLHLYDMRFCLTRSIHGFRCNFRIAVRSNYQNLRKYCFRKNYFYQAICFTFFQLPIVLSLNSLRLE